MPAYRYKGTPIVLQLTEENADAYNRVANAMSEAPEPEIIATHEDHHEVRFELRVKNNSDLVVYNEVAKIINAIIKLGDGIPCDLPRDEHPIFIPV